MSDNRRKIEILADAQFNGDLALAIRHLLENYKEYNCDEYYVEFNDNEKKFTSNILFEMTVKEFGKKTVRTNSSYYMGKMESMVFPMVHRENITLTKEKVFHRATIDKRITYNNIMTIGIGISVLIYLFVLFVAFVNEDFRVLLYPLPVIVAILIVCYIIKFWNKKAIEKESGKELYILKAKCSKIEKNIEYSETDIPSNTIYFNGYIRYIDYDNLASRLQIGTQCYLVCVDGETKAVYIADECILAPELKEIVKE